MVDVYIQRLEEDVELPKYARLGDAGMDIQSNEEIVLAPMETRIISTGLKVAIPEGYEIQLRPRSGMSYKTPLRIANSPGTIDENYRDEIGVIVTNTSITTPYKIDKKSRIAQLVLQKIPRIFWVEVDDVKKIGNDRGGGFGSSGF